MRKFQNCHQKRPHVLPPLMDSQPFVLRPIEPLQPPDLLLSDNRLNSPAPKPNISNDSDNDYNGNDGKPIIKISEPEGSSRKSVLTSSRESLRLDLMSDPLFSGGTDLIIKVQQKNLFKAREAEHKQQDRENVLNNNFTRNQMKNFRHDLNKKFKCCSIRPLERCENLKEKLCPDFKIVQIPKRYATLKPIGHGETPKTEDN